MLYLCTHYIFQHIHRLAKQREQKEEGEYDLQVVYWSARGVWG